MLQFNGLVEQNGKASRLGNRVAEWCCLQGEVATSRIQS